jgi:23S rRNA (cytidine1920-2'-O)/16S rRNA (cytidine1409-2'-O)-methyltransferase
MLVKPQFEAGKGQVGKNGIVREPKIRAEAIANVLTTAQSLGWQFKGLTPSSIQGRTGNHEYLLWLSDEASEIIAPSFEEIIEIAKG